jgi:hypothetical protein
LLARTVRGDPLLPKMPDVVCIADVACPVVPGPSR